MAAVLEQSTSTAVGGFPSVAASFSTTPTVGRVVVVTGVGNPDFGSTAPSIAVTDNQGNTYSVVQSGSGSGVSSVAFIGYAKINTASGTFTVTATGANQGIAIVAQEWSGLDADDILDRTGTDTAQFTTLVDVTASAANTGADRVVVAVGSAGNFQGWSGSGDPISSGYTTIFRRTSGDALGSAGYKIVTASETSSASWGTFDAGGAIAYTLIATLKVAGGGGGVTVDLTATDATDTVSSDADAIVGATLTATDATDTVSSASTMPVTVNLSATDATDTLSSDATVGTAPVTVDLTATDAADTLSSAALVTVGVALSATDATDTLSAASTMPVTANATLADAADTLSATAGPVVGATLSVTDAADTLSAAAIVSQAGVVGITFEQTDATDTLASTATVTNEQRRGSGGKNWARFLDVPLWRVQVQANLTDDEDTLVASASVPNIVVPAARPVEVVLEPQWPVLAAGAELVDDDDAVGCVATVFWPEIPLVRSNARPTGMAVTRSGM